MGVVTHDASGAPRWTLGSSSSGADGSTGMSFHAYVERVLHPYARLPATAGGGERAAVAAANARAKDARRGALGAFYDEGAPGETLLPQVDAMLSKLVRRGGPGRPGEQQAAPGGGGVRVTVPHTRSACRGQASTRS